MLGHAISLLVLAMLLAVPARAEPDAPLRVQLLWYHQSQFAGLYVAEARRHFEAEGLAVEFIEGGHGISPIHELQEGNADIALAWLNNAWELSAPGSRVTNIGQVFTGSGFVVLCRISSEVYTPGDIEGRQIGVWKLGDEIVIREMLRRLGIPEDSVELVRQQPNGADLISGLLPCGSAMTYNEYWRVLEAGVPASDLVIVDPADFGIPHIEDGFYVKTERLQDEAFREKVVRFLQAARKGWWEAEMAPTLALQTVPWSIQELDRDHLRHMLESVNALVEDRESFGRFDLGRFQEVAHSKRIHEGKAMPPRLWTHDIWNELRALDGHTAALTPATRHYAASAVDLMVFKVLLLFGVVIYALSGILEGVKRGYDFWGLVILAFLSAVGGGTIRDLMIGGDQLPLYYVKDPVYPVAIFSMVVISALVVSTREGIADTATFKTVKTYADIIGFSMLAATGALIAVAANLAWFWVPVMAALTCAGGGMLRDIVINQEPKTFKGVIYEEVAVVGALVFLAGLLLANHFEESPVPVYASLIVSILIMILLRTVVQIYGIRYPSPRSRAKPGGHGSLPAE